MPMTRRFVAAALLGSTAALAQDITVQFPGTQLAVEPGQSVDIPIVITNSGVIPTQPTQLVMPGPVVGGYTFEQLSAPDCGPIGPSTIAPDWTESTIGPIPGLTTLTCTIRATRAVDAIDNGFGDWFVEGTNDWYLFQLGTFVDLGIVATKIDAYRGPDGSTHATYRFEVNNASAIDVDNVVIQLGQECVGQPILVDTGSGGCTQGQLSCSFGGAPAPTAILPSVAAGASASCLVGFTAPPGANLTGTVAALFGAAIQNADTGGIMADDNPANDIAPLDLEPQPRGHSAHPAPRSRETERQAMPR
jgi:hypothetical protein